MYFFIFFFFSLRFYIILNCVFIAVLPYCINIKTFWSKFPPPHNFCSTSGCLLNISFAVILFTVRIIFVGLTIGTLWIRKWTCSWSDPISIKTISYRLEISRHISFKLCSTLILKTILLYFAGHTKWYSKTEILWLLCIYSLTPQYYKKRVEAELRGIKPKRLKRDICISKSDTNARF